MGANEQQSIIAEVENALESPEGLAKTRVLHEHMVRLTEGKEDLRSLTLKMRSRPGVRLYTSIGGAKKNAVLVDVRKAGMSCGSVMLTGQKSRLFEPSKAFRSQLQDAAWPVEWDHRQVGTLLRVADARGDARSPTEAAVQDAFIAAMERTSGRDKGLLAGFQPVKLAGLPFQFAVPISARKGVAIPKNSSHGHTDVLARGKGPRLFVIEVKRPGASDIAAALRQSVRYASALRHLMARYQEFYRTMGFGGETPPPITASVLVADTDGARKSISRSARHIGAGPFRLGAFFYRWSGGKIAVTHRVDDLLEREA